MVVDGAGMYRDVMPDGDVVANVRGSCLVRHVDTRAILYVRTVADSDRCHVTAYDGIEPDGTVVAHLDVAHDGGILAEVAVFAPFGR